MARTNWTKEIVLNEALYNPAPQPPVQPVNPPRAPQPVAPATFGLGDLVERYAHPIAVGVDRLTSRLPIRYRTGLAWCTACSRRRNALNAWVSDVRSWASWRGAFQRLIRTMQGRGKPVA